MSLKKDLSEGKLIELGFEKVVVPTEESLEEKEYHYFVYELYNGECLMTQSDNERDDRYYFVEFYIMEGAGKFWNSAEVSAILKVLKSRENV